MAPAKTPDILVDCPCCGTKLTTTPVITTGICSGAEVLDPVGDDAIGWNFVGVATQEDNEALAILQDIMAPVLKIPPSEVDATALGLGDLVATPLDKAGKQPGVTVHANALNTMLTGRFLHPESTAVTLLWVFVIGLAVMGIVPISRGMTRDLTVLADGANQVARGNFAVRVPVRSADEIGRLAQAFNRMAEGVEAHQNINSSLVAPKLSHGL